MVDEGMGYMRNLAVRPQFLNNNRTYRKPPKPKPDWRYCCVSDGRRWNAACKHSRRTHKRNHKDCPHIHEIAATIKRAR